MIHMKPNLDWGPAGGHTYKHCCQCQPCCGKPCNAKSGLICCLNALFCQPCCLAKMWSNSMDQESCGMLNNFAPWMVPVVLWITGFICISTVSPFPNNPVFGVFYAIGLFSIFLAGGFFLYLRTVMRLNLRRKWGIGDPRCNLFDFLMVCCPCSAICELCQEFRSVDAESWDWMAQVKESGLPVKSADFRFVARPMETAFLPTRSDPIDEDVDGEDGDEMDYQHYDVNITDDYDEL